MTHHETPEAAELAALEAALAGDAPDAEWASLVAAVRADAPPPRPRFETDLDKRVAAGFPRRRPRLPKLAPAVRTSVPAFVCVLLIVGLVGGAAISGGGGGDEEATSAAGDVAMSTSEAPSADAPTGAPVPAPSSGSSAGAARESAPSASSTTVAPASPSATPPPGLQQRDRKVERDAQLTLRTPAKGLQDTADGIVRVTQDLGGVVETSSVDSSAAGGDASFVLRIPTAQLPAALKRFGALGDVRRLTQGAEDITGTFISVQDRLSDARAERKALLKALGRASTEARISSLRARIANNLTTIGRLEGDVRSLRRRTDTARVDVQLTASGTRSTAPSEEDGEGGAWGPGDAARDALRVLEVLAGVALIALAVLLPLALLAGAAALGGRGLQRRRREAALG